MITTRHVADHIAARVAIHLHEHGYGVERIHVIKLPAKKTGIKIDIKGIVFTVYHQRVFMEWDNSRPILLDLTLDVSKFRFEWNITTGLLEISRWS